MCWAGPGMAVLPQAAPGLLFILPAMVTGVLETVFKPKPKASETIIDHDERG